MKEVTLMSITHYIQTKETLNFEQLNTLLLSIKNITYEKRGLEAYYYWIDKKSTRGVDITIESHSVEVRNTTLSNSYDYDLTNQILDIITLLTKGIVFNESDEQVINFPIFSNEKITQLEIYDCEMTLKLSKELGDLAIFSPIRKVHFGNELHEKFKYLSGEKLKEEMFNIILKVNYQIPNFEYGDIFQFGEQEDSKKLIKILTNESNCIIDKYDYIALNIVNDQPIVITNKILNSILPANWVRVDEFTIVAPILSNPEWDKLLIKAKPFDIWHELQKNPNH